MAVVPIGAGVVQRELIPKLPARHDFGLGEPCDTVHGVDVSDAMPVNG